MMHSDCRRINAPVMVTKSEMTPIHPLLNNAKDFQMSAGDATPMYFSNTRPEMLAIVPTDIRTVLEVGCGAGRFGLALRKRQESMGKEIIMTGIEFDSTVALEAKGVFHKLLVGDFASLAPQLPSAQWDCVIGNDVLEHLENPWAALSQCLRLLAPGGHLVLSVPNVRFFGNVKSLVLNGQWRYEDSGILDRTHLRFFTRASLAEDVRAAGFEILSIQGINRQVHGWKMSLVNALFRNRFNDLSYLQFAIHAKRPAIADV